MSISFLTVACASPAVRPAAVDANTANIIKLIERAAGGGAELVVFPELSVTGYTCGDLFHSTALLEASGNAIEQIARATAAYAITVVVGAPCLVGGSLYNCAWFLAEGAVKAIVPKTYLPNYNEFYERRWFESGATCPAKQTEEGIPFGTDILVDVAGAKVAAEICEDLWVPVPPSCKATLAGADVVVNLSASDDLIGKYDYLRSLLSQQSARCLCGYAYASAGSGESSTDLVFDGKLFIYENGRELAANIRWRSGNQIIFSQIDIEALRRDRMHLNSFAACRATENAGGYRLIEGSGDNVGTMHPYRTYDPLPFVPSDRKCLRERCEEIIDIQARALATRLDAIRCSKLVVGISGGLDSTLALLVATRAFDSLGLDRKGIIGVTMPGFGTTGRTHSNSLTLMATLGVDAREIPIGKAVLQHFDDIGQDPELTDVTYENSQARERTQILMDLANKENGIVLGTGDLSELALGWATYNGDHMSMYAVNAGVPKTLVRHLVRYFALQAEGDERRVLLDIVDTPISPELTPANTDGTIAQKTEDLVGPYELHDFFLYYTLRYGFTPRRIYIMAIQAFMDTYSMDTIKKWLKVFFRRFFSQQFKRSCMPDGPKVGSVCLSPRGDWRMPSDASAEVWLRMCDEL